MTRLETYHEVSFNGFNILQVGGQSPDGSLTSQTSVYNKQFQCQNLDDFPFELDAAIGTFFNNQAIVCGGYLGPEEGRSNKCYKFQNGTWSHFATLDAERSSAAMVAFEWYQGDPWIMITGGHNSTSILNSTEVVRTDGQVMQFHGRMVENPTERHCMLKAEKDDDWVIIVFVIGGFNGTEYLRTTWRSAFGFYKPLQRAPMEMLNFARGNHECTMFSSLNHEGRQVALVAGGQNWDGPVMPIEILDYQMPGSLWVSVQNLPFAMEYKPGVLAQPENHEVLLVYEDTVLGFQAKDGYYWFVEYPVKPALPRHWSVTMMIPEAFGPHCTIVL